MAGNEPFTVVADAGPIIHLDELFCLDLLGDWGKVLIPGQVWNEVVRHRPHLLPADIPNGGIVQVNSHEFSPDFMVLTRSLSLDIGEQAALALMRSSGAQILLCDDAAARLAGESMGYQVHGTLGLLVRSIRTGRRTRQQIISLLEHLPNKSTLYISHQLLAAVIKTVKTS
jgi:predicted nucleic acid-binding protein